MNVKKDVEDKAKIIITDRINCQKRWEQHKWRTYFSHILFNRKREFNYMYRCR